LCRPTSGCTGARAAERSGFGRRACAGPVNLIVGPLHLMRRIVQYDRLRRLAVGPLLVLLFASTVSGVATGQSPRTQNVPRHPIERPTNCEDTGLFRDEVVVAAREAPEADVILIARLGTGERSRTLSQRRLKALASMFRSWSGLATVVAEGEAVGGLGRVEAYVAGRRYRVFVYARGAHRPDCTGI
jgi:hypothetical protein